MQNWILLENIRKVRTGKKHNHAKYASCEEAIKNHASMRYFTLQNRISSLGTDEDKACSSIEGFCVLFCFAVALLFNSLIFLEYSEAKVFSS